MKKRIDQWLVESGLASSRTQAKDLIDNKQVVIYFDNKKQFVLKANQTFSIEDLNNSLKPEILVGEIGKYVSRAGLKLAGALDHLKLNVDNYKALDVGVSTGGFSEVLLQRGALQVFGLDVGHDQTHEILKSNPRFFLFEGVNAKELIQRSDITGQFPVEGFDLVVMDVSFIRSELIWPQIFPYLKKKGKLLSLIKPQFEVGAAALNKKGVVKDEGLYILLQQNLEKLVAQLGFQKLDYFESSIKGKEGNREFFLFAQKEGI